MRVIANGEAFDLPAAQSVAEFVRDRGLDPKFVVVERNGEPLERSGYDSVKLKEGDRIELVRAVAGG